MAFCGGRRRSRKRQRKKQDHLLWIIAGAACVLLSLVCIPVDDVGDREQGGRSSRAAASTLRQERCRSSCEDVILNSGRSLSDSLLSSSALASSAVDALFLLRDADAAETQEDTSSTRKRRKEKAERESERPSSGGNDAVRYNNGDDFWRKVDPPPTRLPPLIETLVGSVDGTYPYRGYGQRGQKKGLIAQGDTSGVTTSSGTKAQRGAGTSDESVAMAAAAAAAAFWSQTTGRGTRRRHNMKVVNDEWERSLRWIAGWGQNPEAVENAKASLSSSTGQNRKSQKSEKRGRKANYSSRNEVDTNDVRLSFLDACTKECVGNGVSDSRKHTSSLGEWSKHSSQLLLSFIASILTGKMTAQWGSGFSAEQKALLTGTFRIALSSAVLFGLRSAWQWLESLWSPRRTQDTVWFSEEETVEARASSKNGRKNSSKKKASLSRRSRRRNQSARVQRDTTKVTEGEELESTLVSSRNENQDEDEVDFDSLQRLVASNNKHRASSRRVTSRQPSSSSALDEHGSMGSLSKHSERTFPGNPNVQRTKTTASISKASATGAPFIPVSTPKSSKQRAASSGKGGEDAGQQNQRPSLPSPQFACCESGSDKISGHLLVASVSPEGDLSPFDFSKQPSLLGSLQQNSPAVPTDEQRELASRQLREYQRVQVLKIMQRRGILHSTKSNAVATPVSPPAFAASNIISASICSTGQRGREATVIAPPPGLIDMRDTGTIAASPSYEGADVDSLASGKLLPSNILDGFEDEHEANASSASKAKPKLLSANLRKVYSPVFTGFGGSVEHTTNSSRGSCWGPLLDTQRASETSALDVPLDSTTLSTWASSDGSDGGSSAGKPASW